VGGLLTLLLGGCGLLRPPSVEESAVEATPAASTTSSSGADPAAASDDASPTDGQGSDQAAPSAEVTSRTLQALLSPTFRTAKGSAQRDWSAGTGFLLRWDDGRTLLVTAFHLFGPDGGVQPQMTMPQMLRTVTGVDAQLWTSGQQVRGARALNIADADADHAGGDYSHDVAAFGVADPGTAGVLRLATRPPAVGDRVFVPWNRDGGGGRLVGGTVRYAKDRQLFFAEDDPTIVMNGTSGAPILDVNGDVVGINLAGAEQGGISYSGGGTLANLRASISEGIAAPAGTP